MEHQESQHPQMWMPEKQQQNVLEMPAPMPQVMESRVHTWSQGGLQMPELHSVDRFVSSGEVTTLYPQPQRAFPHAAFDRPPTPSSPFSRSDDRSYELQELLGRKPPIDHGAEDLVCGRPLSSLSTCAGLSPAGPTPTLEESFSRPSSGYAASPQRAAPRDDVDSPGASGSGPGASPLSRKVFVGGIPQDFTQADLSTFFAEYGKVKKAWLQRCRSNTTTTARPQNHRGFGFVIFRDDAAITKLLGDSFNRFLAIADGRKLEVKRALSSTALIEGPPPATGSGREQRGQGGKGPAPSGQASSQRTQQAGPEHENSPQGVPMRGGSSVSVASGTVAAGNMILQLAAAPGQLISPQPYQARPEDFRAMSMTPPPYNYVAMQQAQVCSPLPGTPGMPVPATYLGVPQRVPSPVFFQGPANGLAQPVPQGVAMAPGGPTMPISMQFAQVPVMPGGMMATAAQLGAMGRPLSMPTAHMQAAPLGVAQLQFVPAMQIPQEQHMHQQVYVART